MKILTTVTAAVAALALSVTPAAAAEPGFSFEDCPAIPAGADPGMWRCEVLISHATISFGTVRDLQLGTMRLTFAEGTLDGQYAQVFGALRAEPTRVRGLSLRLRYAGYADFQSNDERKGELDLAISVDGPFLPPGCTIGDEHHPIHSVLKSGGPTEVISTDPLTLRFATTDDQMAFPQASHCGGGNEAVSRRLGLPSPSGANHYAQTTLVRLRGY